MINYLKRNISNFPLLMKLLLPIYINTKNIYFWIYKTFNSYFSFTLHDKTKIKFFPKGQIAKGLFFNEFEKKELEIFQLLLTNGSILIDAGANIGLYSIVGSRLIGPTGKVFSFEPSKSTFNLLLNNIKLNKVKNIIPTNIGLGDNIGETISLSHNIEGGDAENYILKSQNETIILDNGLNKNQLTESITLDTLDNFQLKNNIKKVDFLKIDVEGYEYYLLKGAENLLKNNPEIIILFECADHLAKRAGAKQTDVFDFLNNLGIDIAYWDENEKKWSNNQEEAMIAGQLVGGRNIIQILDNLYSN